MKSYTVVLTAAELDVLSKALMEMPYKMAAPVVDSINKQLAPQMEPETKPKSD